jgi:helicase
MMLNWAWQHGDLTAAIRQSYRLDDYANVDVVRASFFTAVRRWLFGDTYAQIATASGQGIDDVLAIQTAAISFGLQSVIEQALSLLSKLIESRGGQIAPSVAIFSELLRFGVPNQTASMLCSSGVRHRRAAILLAGLVEIQGAIPLGRAFIFAIASQALRNDEAAWRDRLGFLVYANTLADVS